MSTFTDTSKRDPMVHPPWQLGDVPLNGHFVHPVQDTVWRVWARVRDRVEVKHHGTGTPATLYADAEVFRLIGDSPRKLVDCAGCDAWDSRDQVGITWDPELQTWRPHDRTRWDDEVWWPIMRRPHLLRDARSWRVDGEYLRRGADYIVAGTVDPGHLAAHLADFDPRPSPETIIDRWDTEGGRAGELIAALRKHGYRITDIEEQQ